MRPYRSLVLDQALVVPAQRGNEQKAVDAFKAVDPFLAFRALAADIEHVIRERAKLEECLGDAGCPQA